MKKLGRKSKYLLYALSGSLMIALLKGFSILSVIDGLSVVAIILLILTLCKIVGNIGIFDSFIFGAKMIGELLSNKRNLLASGSEGYYDYKKNRKRASDVGDLCFTTAVFMSVSILSSVLVCI